MQIKRADSEGVFYLEREAAPFTREMINLASVFIKLQRSRDPVLRRPPLRAAAAQSTPSQIGTGQLGREEPALPLF